MSPKRIIWTILLLFAFLVGLCAQASDPAAFYRGVDLSFVNEVQDHGGQYREKGQLVDPFALFAHHQANLIRVRLWIDAGWTDYSNLADVKKTIGRAKAQGMNSLLDFHYSNDWADPGKQGIPPRWKDLSDAELTTAVYEYTKATLEELAADGLLPAMVQVGNETNQGMLKRIVKSDWPRDAALFNAGIKAVREVAAANKTSIEIVLHVAQPQNCQYWFSQARKAGVVDFDIIGMSYYPQWSMYTIEQTGKIIASLRQEFGKKVMIVETGLPWTLDNADTASNLLSQGIRGYTITPEGQKQFMVDLVRTVYKAGGYGVIYWEPAWISSSAKTRWGKGSHWENASFFDFHQDNEVLPAIDFLSVKLD